MADNIRSKINGFIQDLQSEDRTNKEKEPKYTVVENYTIEYRNGLASKIKNEVCSGSANTIDKAYKMADREYHNLVGKTSIGATLSWKDTSLYIDGVKEPAATITPDNFPSDGNILAALNKAAQEFEQTKATRTPEAR